MAAPNGIWGVVADALAKGRSGMDFTPKRSAGGAGPEPIHSPDALGQFINVALPRPYSIPWRVNFKNMRWADLNPAGPLDPAQPLDNQVATAPLIKMELTWGTDVMETALVDYPWGGVSFNVNARVVTARMSTFNAVIGDPYGLANQCPTVGVWVTPAIGVASGGLAERKGPTFTTPIQALPLPSAASFALFPVPARAVAYRVFSDVGPQLTTSGYLSKLEQVGFSTAFGPVFSIDYDGSFGLAQVNAPSSASRWWPLHQAGTFIRATNTNLVDADGAQRVGVQFALDLG